MLRWTCLSAGMRGISRRWRLQIPGTRSHALAFELCLPHAMRLGLGQLAAEFHEPRHHKAGNPLPGKNDEIRRREVTSPLGHDDGHDLVLTELRRDTEHRRLHDGGMLIEDALHLPRRYVLPAPTHGVGLAVHEIEVSVGVGPHEVPASELPAGDLGLARGAVLVVLDLTVGGVIDLKQQLTGLARRSVVGFVVHDSIWIERLADGSLGRLPEIHDHEPTTVHGSVPLDYPNPESAFELRPHRCGTRRTAIGRAH